MTLLIETERLVLRRFTQADARDLLEFASHPSVTGAVPEIDATEVGIREYINLQNSYQPFEQDKVFDLAIERKKDGKVIGLLTLIRRENTQGAIGWAVGIEHRGQGYATEAARALMTYAFATLSLHRIEAETSIGNESSWRVMERLGMRREGHLPEATVQDGQWLDTYTYAILATEWQRR